MQASRLRYKTNQARRPEEAQRIPGTAVLSPRIALRSIRATKTVAQATRLREAPSPIYTRLV